MSRGIIFLIFLLTGYGSESCGTLHLGDFATKFPLGIIHQALPAQFRIKSIPKALIFQTKLLMTSGEFARLPTDLEGMSLEQG